MSSPASSPAPSPGPGAPATGGRTLPIDVLRGLVMVLMALDHASLFLAGVHWTEIWSQPLPVYGDALHFLTRWLTHFCAPGFFLLMGAGMALFAHSRRGAEWSWPRIGRHLALRGTILVCLQFLAENPAWSILAGGSLRSSPYFGVLYGLGGAMLVWSPLLRLPVSAVLPISLAAMLAPAAMLPPHDPTATFPAVLRLLLVPGASGGVFVLYPLIPWAGVTGLGLVLGRILHHGQERARIPILAAGLSALALFLVLRTAGQSLDFHLMAGHGRLSMLSLLSVTKYPPSPAFLLLTLGGNLTLLALLMRAGHRVVPLFRQLAVLGQAPLLFYLAHLYLYGLIRLLLPHPVSLPGVYPLWLAGVLVLYPACAWYGRFKRTTGPASVWRML